MRATRFLILIFAVLSACKTSQVTSSRTEPYREDLSGLRMDLSTGEETAKEDTTQIAVEQVTPEGHIKSELDSINKIIIEKNRRQKFVDGYTIQIYTGIDREAAALVRQKANELELDIEPVIEYIQPNYKVKVGQYLNRLKAHEVYEALKIEFPLALLIPERIEVDYD